MARNSSSSWSSRVQMVPPDLTVMETKMCKVPKAQKLHQPTTRKKFPLSDRAPTLKATSASSRPKHAPPTAAVLSKSFQVSSELSKRIQAVHLLECNAKSRPFIRSSCETDRCSSLLKTCKRVQRTKRLPTLRQTSPMIISTLPRTKGHQRCPPARRVKPSHAIE